MKHTIKLLKLTAVDIIIGGMICCLVLAWLCCFCAIIAMVESSWSQAFWLMIGFIASFFAGTVLCDVGDWLADRLS